MGTARYLLQDTYDPSSMRFKMEVILGEAAGTGHEDVVRFLVQRNACKTGMALVTATTIGRQDIVRLLLLAPRRPAASSVRTALGRAHSEGDAALVSILAGALGLSEAQATALVVSRKLRQAAEKNMLRAAARGHVDELRDVLLRGATEKHERPRANMRDGFALTIAARNGHVEVVRVLLEAGVRADCRKGHALVLAARSGHFEIVRMLSEWPVHASKAGGAAIENAANERYWDIVNYLVARLTTKVASGLLGTYMGLSDDVRARLKLVRFVRRN